MLLRDIALYLNVDEYERHYRSDFGFRSRYICNYLVRRLKPLKVHTNKFSRICVQGCHVPEEACPVVSEAAAMPTVFFDSTRYEALGPEDHHEFFISMLLEGLEKCARYHQIPLFEMKEAIEDFRREDYLNQWTHLRKTLRPVGIEVSLLCTLDTHRFALTLKVERARATLFEQVILETKPDETIYAFQFKEVAFEGSSVVVKNRFGNPVFSVGVSQIGISM
jgi:hypothetical protein